MTKQDRELFQELWQTNHVAWSEQLREAIALYRNIQHLWHFSPEQQVLQRYYDANQLLIDCLNSNSGLTQIDLGTTISRGKACLAPTLCRVCA